MKQPALVVLVRVKSPLAEDEMMAIARERADQFRALGGLLQKFYLHDPATGEYLGLYLWDSQEALTEFGNSELRATIAEAYRATSEPQVDVLRVMMALRDGG